MLNHSRPDPQDKILEEMGREKCGFHAFRRYRVTHLRTQRVPEDLLRFWIGHADGSVTVTQK